MVKIKNILVIDLQNNKIKELKSRMFDSNIQLEGQVPKIMSLH